MTEEQQTDEEKEKLKKRNKKFRKKLTKLSIQLLFLAFICFIGGIALVAIQRNNSDFRLDDFFKDSPSASSLGEAFYTHYYWPNYGVGIWSSVFTFISGFISFYGLKEKFHRSLIVVHIASCFVSIPMEFSSFVIAAWIASLYTSTYNNLPYLILNVLVSVLCLIKMTLLLLSVVTGFKAVPNCLTFASTQLNSRYQNVEAHQIRMQTLQPGMHQPQVMMTNRGPMLVQNMPLATPQPAGYPMGAVPQPAGYPMGSVPQPPGYPMGAVPPPQGPPPSYSEPTKR